MQPKMLFQVYSSLTGGGRVGLRVVVVVVVDSGQLCSALGFEPRVNRFRAQHKTAPVADGNHYVVV